MDSRKALQIIVILALVGMALDAFLTFNKITLSRIGCPVGGGCDIVSNSPYSEFFGIPVSIFGFGAFMFFMVAALLAINEKIAARTALQLIIAFSAFGLAIVAWFIYLMYFVIGAICLYCMASHIMLLLVFGISVIALIKLK